MEVLIILSSMAVVLYYYNKKKSAFDNSDGYKLYLDRVSRFDEEYSKLLKFDGYINYKQVEYLIDKYNHEYKFFNTNNKDIKSKEGQSFGEKYKKMPEKFNKKNEEYIAKQLIKNKALFDNIDGKALDLQQRRAVIIDDLNNLIVAGAGSGKTLTISAKTKYLVKNKISLPEEILLISFTKQSALEMEERVKHKLGININVSTFHKLGLDIITKERGQRPEIESKLNESIEMFFKEKIYKKNTYLMTLINFFAYYIQVPKEVSDFENLESYNEYKMSLDFETLSSKSKVDKYIDEASEELKSEKRTFANEKVKSYEELIIANFLFINNVKYEYEREYPFDCGDPFKKTYRPDFYLPDYDLYLEHFGIDKNNRTPQYTAIEEKKYIEGIIWKRETHKENKTTLLESYSYWNKDDQLTEKLKKLLLEHSVEIKRKDDKELFECIFKSNENKYLSEFKKLISTFIGLFKSRDLRINDFNEFESFAEKEKTFFLRNRSVLFFKIVKPIYEHYQAGLKANKAIDFNDMINEATKYINMGNVKLNYRYIIIDEYQDISYSRYNLIKAIKMKTNGKLLCVGDDWQSIYRFAGSDISLFSNFEMFYGSHTTSKIEKTYRNSQQLIDVAGKFVLSNKSQMKKNLKSDLRMDFPIELIPFEDNKINSLIIAIDLIVLEHGKTTDILFVGRNNFDVDFIKSSKLFNLKETKEVVQIKYLKHPKINITFLTAHRSKGLEATNVVILNGDNHKMGFPNKLSDDPVLSYVLKSSENFLFSEERRLFYVALTRTKNKTYILFNAKKPSVFVKEIQKNKLVKINKSLLSDEAEEVKCPKCLVGNLVKRESGKRIFIGCSNYPSCDFSHSNLDILTKPVKCSCGSYLVKRSGKFGSFLGCINYPTCKETMQSFTEEKEIVI